MQWQEVHVIISPGATEMVALLLYECGSNGAIVEDTKIDDTTLVRVTGYFPLGGSQGKALVVEKMKEWEDAGLINGPWHVTTKDVDDTSWLYTWQDYFHVTPITDTCRVIPYKEVSGISLQEKDIIIDPGVSFGSGLHVTTSMCMQLIEKCGTQGHVLDIGTGTGILAIMAAKCGAQEVIAVDLDEQAVIQAKKNVLCNEVSSRVKVQQSDLVAALAGVSYRADLVVANLVTDAILALFTEIGHYMDMQGKLIISGIIDERIQEIRSAASKYGFIILEEHLQEGWYALCLKREG